MRKKHSENVPSLISKGIRLEAELLSGKGTVRIEGEYFGDIMIDGELMLEQSGHVCGNVIAKAAYISGSISGNINCSELLHIKTNGKVKGDIECQAVLMDEGAVFIGYSKMFEQAPEPADLLGVQTMIEEA